MSGEGQRPSRILPLGAVPEAAPGEVLEAKGWLYGDTVKIALLSSGWWAIYDRGYALRGILPNAPTQSELEELWRGSSIREAYDTSAQAPRAGAPKPKFTPRSGPRPQSGGVDIDLEDLFK